MSAHDGWSDSDSEKECALTDVETSVELGIPNGDVTSAEDLEDPMVSRIGGIPVRLHILSALEHPVLKHHLVPYTHIYIKQPYSLFWIRNFYHAWHQSFLSKSPPAFDSSYCKICASPAELLVQLWCPLQDSPYDRVLYVWGCSRRGCQKKDGRQVHDPPPQTDSQAEVNLKLSHYSSHLTFPAFP